ncbi:MAG: hypothetical protein AMXMBFR33_69800 [Candidatus Xenobia bacterium]
MAILSASVGAGHMRAAQALERLGRDAPLKVRSLDVLELFPRPFQALYKDAYLEMVGKAPVLFEWIYELTDRPFAADILRTAFEEASAIKFFAEMEEYRPDLVLCTHFLPSTLLALRRRKKLFAGKIFTVVTDFDVHGMWLATPSDHTFVAVEEARAYLASFGIDPATITVSGIPTDPVFALSKDRLELASRHGLRTDLPTLLISSGGFGVTNVTEILDALAGLAVPVQVITACGRNKALKADLDAYAARHPERHLHVLGFTDAMDEYMELADLMVGKPGGLTTWESFQKGLAWVVVNPIPGQEERNTYHLLEEGVGIWCYEPRTLAFKLGQLLRDPERLAAMQAAARRLARPDAGHVIWEKAFEALELEGGGQSLSGAKASPCASSPP